MSSHDTGRRAATLGAAAAAVMLGALLIVADKKEVPPEPSATPQGHDDTWLAAERAEFVSALHAAQAGADVTGSVEDSAKLRAYPLYPYLEAARLRRALATAHGAAALADTASRAFLARYGEQPVARPVRAARLDSLARRGLWSELLAEADGDSSGSTALRCQRLQARIAVGDTGGLAAEIESVWLNGRRLPPECEPPFEWLRAAELMTDELIEQRTRLLLENGQTAFARVIANRLPAERAAPWLRWADAVDRPADTLDRLITAPDVPLPDGALDDAWQRLARNRPADALARFPALVAAFELDAEAISEAARVLALGLAWDRRPEALELFARVAREHLDDYALGWLARAALWAGDFRRASDAIGAMSPAQQQETRWRYWAARAAQHDGQHRRARALFRSVLPTDNYYAAMAAAHLGVRITPGQQSVPVEDERLGRLAAQPPFVRARELRLAGMPSEAVAEWRYGAASLDASDGPQTIHLAMRWGWYDVGVATATSHRIFDDYRLLYPRPFRPAVAHAAASMALDEALLYGVIRQESLYRPDAASAAGALGLAQLRPETARRVARRIDHPAPSRADLLVPEVNLLLGAAELRSLLDQFGGQLPLALAGYNAGPNAARRWAPAEPLDADIWIENIPFNETRDYVQRVLWHTIVFEWLERGGGRDTREWLAPIEPVTSREL